MNSDAAVTLRVRALYEEVVRWTNRADNYEFMCAEPQEKLEAFARGEPIPAGVVLTRMQFLASWLSAKNVAALVESDSASRSSLCLAHSYGLWEVRLARQLFRADTRARRRPRLSRNTVALCVARAAALGLLDDCQVLGRILLEEYDSGLLHQDGSTLAPFVARLFSEWQGVEPPSLGSDIPEQQEYLDILALWQTPEGNNVAAPLERACQLHLDRTHDDSDQDIQEFSDQVYALYPVEILMVLQLRAERALPEAKIEHPLMSMPMGRLVKAARPEDPLLQRVANRVARELTA